MEAEKNVYIIGKIDGTPQEEALRSKPTEIKKSNSSAGKVETHTYLHMWVCVCGKDAAQNEGQAYNNHCFNS